MNRRVATVVAVLAAMGLVVSITAAWSRIEAGPPVQVVEAGPRPAASPPGEPRAADASERRDEPLQAPAPPSRRSGESRAPEVGRSNASLGSLTAAGPSARPVRVRVGGIDINAAVRPVGVLRDGQMRLPADPRVFGWYRYGPAPDTRDRGSVVIAGHLDSRRFGLGPLVRLRDAEVGDTVRVTLSSGKRATYRVTRIQRFDRQGLPAHLFSRTGPHRLRLITCGGAYDAGAGGYQQNLVVTAEPVRR